MNNFYFPNSHLSNKVRIRVSVAVVLVLVVLVVAFGQPAGKKIKVIIPLVIKRV